MLKLVESALWGIIVQELEISPDRVAIYNTRYQIPKDNDLFIVIENTGSTVFSNRTHEETRDDTLYEIQNMSCRSTFNIEICSRNDDALRRKEDVYFALNSTYAQNAQEVHSFKISRLGPIRSAPEEDGAARLYRFISEVICFSWYEKEKAIRHYDTFPLAISDDFSISDSEILTDT